MKHIDEIIVSLIKDATNVEVYPLFASLNAKLPLIIYGEERFSTIYSKDGLSGYVSDYSIDIYSEDYDQCAELEMKVIAALRKWKSGETSSVKINGGSSDYLDNCLKTINITISHGAG